MKKNIASLVLAIIGAIFGLIGGIQSYNRKKGGLVCSVLGLLFQVAVLIASCVHVGGFSFLLELCTIVAIILLLVQVIMAARKLQPNEPSQPNQQ